MFLRSTDQTNPHTHGDCPEKMSIAYVCLVAVVAVLAGVVIALIGL